MPIHKADRWMVGSNASGFTLFETLAATMILAIALVVVLQLFSGGLRASTLSNQYTAAIFHAREKMEELLLASVLVDSQPTGSWDDGYAWRADIARQPTENPTAAQLSAQDIFTIDLTIHWQDGSHHRQITISTLGLAKVADDSAR